MASSSDDDSAYHHAYPLHDAAEAGDMETLSGILRPPPRNVNKPTMGLPAARAGAALPAAGEGGEGDGGVSEEGTGAAATAGGGDPGNVREGKQSSCL